jgi:hypothetical protein
MTHVRVVHNLGAELTRAVNLVRDRARAADPDALGHQPLAVARVGPDHALHHAPQYSDSERLLAQPYPGLRGFAAVLLQRDGSFGVGGPQAETSLAEVSEWIDFLEDQDGRGSGAPPNPNDVTLLPPAQRPVASPAALESQDGTGSDEAPARSGVRAATAVAIGVATVLSFVFSAPPAATMAVVGLGGSLLILWRDGVPVHLPYRHIAIAAVSAVLAAAATLGVQGAVRGSGAHSHPGARPSVAESIALQYFEETRASPVWTGQPTLFPASFDAFKKHFSILDPRRSHRFVDAGTRVPLAMLPANAPGLAGQVMLVTGKIIDGNVVSTRSPGDFLMQLAAHRAGRSPLSVRQIVFCRVPARASAIPPRGSTVTVRGIVIAAGEARFGLGGFRASAYLACSAFKSGK